MQQYSFSKIVIGVLFTTGLIFAGPAAVADVSAKTKVEHSARHSHGKKHWHGKAMQGPDAHRKARYTQHGKHATSKRHTRRGKVRKATPDQRHSYNKKPYRKRYHTLPKSR